MRSQNRTEQPTATFRCLLAQRPARVPIIHIPSLSLGDAPDFVEVGEAGVAVDHAMRR
jgi:hypothetical protein